MSAEEVDSIMRIQWRSVHTADPYSEDYYYQVCGKGTGSVELDNVCCGSRRSVLWN